MTGRQTSTTQARARVRTMACAAVVALLAACEEAPRPPEGAAAPPAVFVARVERQPIAQGAEFIGRVEAIDKLELRARVTGFLQARHFNEGDRVTAGTLMFTIEQAPFAAEVALREAQVNRGRADLQYATAQVARGQELLRTNAIPQSTLDERVAAEAQAKAELDSAQAQLEQARIQYGYTEIRAAFDGRAGRSPLSPGNVVGPDTGVLVTVVRDDPIRVTFPVTQRELLAFRRRGGEQQADRIDVRIRLPDGSMLDATGRVEFIDVAANRSTDSVLVQAVVPNTQRLLTDGQAVTVVTQAADRVEALVIPQSALQIDQQGPFALVVGAENRVEVKRIRTTPGPAGLVVVREGLEAGQLVITEGSGRARPGQPVTARPQEAPAGAATPARGG